ncbi:hypothetical protein SAMN04488564_112161 [Lentzea waywayandensis]|uniref:Uncharacterized protein n=2 Tax=Lentzea waywayandensis TaxID=84724 RepID=A0A1I6FDP6_9PSEU|nr:hypothetical protein SAMN04488564_112161 [Lentzea waywayandensis]
MDHEDKLRTTFSVLRGEVPPPNANSAFGVITRGRAVRSRRRTIAVAGSAVATAGVTALALAFLPDTSSPPPVPGPPLPTSTTTTSGVRTTPKGVPERQDSPPVTTTGQVTTNTTG